MLVFISVPFWGSTWHFFHGESLYYREWKIPVPSNFYVRGTGSDRPSMWRMTLGMPITRGPYGHISVYTQQLPGDRPFSYKSDYQRFSNVINWQERQNGFTLRSHTALPVDRTVAYCLDFAHRENATKTLMDCAIDNSRIVVFYDGDRKYLSEFLTTLQGMSRIK